MKSVDDQVRTAPRTARRLRAWLAPVAAAAVVLASSSTAGVPRYHAAPETTCPTCLSTRLVVGDTFTGAKLAAFTPPTARRSRP